MTLATRVGCGATCVHFWSKSKSMCPTAVTIGARCFTSCTHTEQHGSRCHPQTLLELPAELTRSAAQRSAAQRRAAKFQVDVCCRFRPNRRSTGEEKTSGRGVKVALPLHQKLQLIRSARKCTAREALSFLFTGEEHKSQESSEIYDPFVNASLGLRREQKQIEVDEKEHEAKAQGQGQGDHMTRASVLAVKPQQVLMCAPGVGLRAFSFGRVLNSESRQTDVYRGSVRPLVVDFVNGQNVTVMAYGQTGSGKTFTMFGADETTGTSLLLSDQSGIMPRVCVEIWSAMQARMKNGIDQQLRMSMIEVYGDEVTDLLDNGRAVGQWAGVAARAVMQGAAAVEITSDRKLEELLSMGQRAQRRAATAMNERSSRAHVLLIFSLQQTVQRGSEHHNVTSQLCLADLGGSEQVKQSKVTGERLHEAIMINQGLLALKNCITALHERRTHVPFNDSKLTQLLSGSLGGNAKTLVLVTASEHENHALQTLQTLRFGEKCSTVENIAKRSVLTAADAIKTIDDEISHFEELIKSKERWESVETKRFDTDEEGRITEESVVASKLVGAESERAKLESLLEQRRQLIS